MVAEQISPELALVCPELRAKAIAALPEHPWLASTPRRAEGPISRSPADDLAEASGYDYRAMARDASAYVLARAAGLLAIMAAIVVLVLILARIAGSVHG